MSEQRLPQNHPEERCPSPPERDCCPHPSWHDSWALEPDPTFSFAPLIPDQFIVINPVTFKSASLHSQNPADHAYVLLSSLCLTPHWRLILHSDIPKRAQSQSKSKTPCGSCHCPTSQGIILALQCIHWSSSSHNITNLTVPCCYYSSFSLILHFLCQFQLLHRKGVGDISSVLPQKQWKSIYLRRAAWTNTMNRAVLNSNSISMCKG